MTVTVYRSTDASAPVLTTAVGDLVNVLDKVLVDGYGAKPALGWTKPYTGTNTAAFKQPAGTTNGFYLYVDDNNPNTDTTNAGRSARVRGYETMSAVAVGTGLFPTALQQANALQVIKSTETSSATAVNWVIVGTNKFFYMWVKPVLTHVGTSGIGGDVGHMWGFGDYISYKSGDAYNTCLIASSQSGASAAASSDFQMVSTVASMTSLPTNMYGARAYNQQGTGIVLSKIIDQTKAGNVTIMGTGAGGVTQMLYPNPVDQGIYTSPVWVAEPVFRALRGVLPGIHCPFSSVALFTGDQFTGATGSALDGKTLEAFSCGYSTGANSTFGQVYLEVSNTW